MGKVLPSETAARACAAKLAIQKEEQVQDLPRGKKLFSIVDETKVAKQKYVKQFFCGTKFKNSFYKSRIHLDFSYSITLL